MYEVGAKQLNQFWSPKSASNQKQTSNLRHCRNAYTFYPMML